MKDILQKHKRKAISAVALLIAAACAVALFIQKGAENTAYAEETAQRVTMEQTLTAAGEIRQYKSKKVKFDTDLVFQGLCVEAGDAVEKGDPLIQYDDGTTTDSPASGVVTKLSAPATGEYATSSNYVKVAYTDKLLLSITIPEDEINLVNVGDKAEVVVNADTSKTYSGRITSVQAIPDADTGGYTVKIRLKNDGTLKIGMSASCTVTVSSRDDVLAVPIDAVQFDDQDRAYVMLSRDGKAVKRKVTTGESDANNVEITKGLAEGDVILVEE